MKLKVKDNYKNREIRYKKGDVIEVSEEEARFLQADSPGCFSVVRGKAEKQEKEIEAPPADKAMKKDSSSKRK